MNTRHALLFALASTAACSSSPAPDATPAVDAAPIRDAAPAPDAAASPTPDAGTPDVGRGTDAAPPATAHDGGAPHTAHDAAAPDTAPVALEVTFARVGFDCAGAGAYAFGDGSLLICEAGKFRYAMRSDVPDGPPGGFTARPAWYPPLRLTLGLEPASCPARLPLAAPPMDPAAVAAIIPNGMMVSNHVTPIDHWYVVPHVANLEPGARAAASPAAVTAVADGTIIEVSSLGSPTSMRVTIAHGCETASVYMVLNELTGPLAAYQDQVAGGGFVTMRIPIKAGETFALQRDTPFDYSLHDGATWLPGFAHPFPYVSGDAWKPYTVDPLPYWPEAIGMQLEQKLQRTEAPRAGKIDWDKAGTAAGNWYLEGTIGYGGQPTTLLQNATAQVPGGQVEGKNSYAWSHMALAPHWVQPSVWIASLGTWRDPKGDFPQYALRPGPARPDALTAAAGTVVYELVPFSDVEPDGSPLRAPQASRPVGHGVALGTNVAGVLAVRVNANGTLTVEKRPDLTSASAFTGFTAKAETYWR